jgi:hypothetical protein
MAQQVVNQQRQVIGTVTADIKTQGITAWFKNNTRTIEKLIAYGAAAVGATNGFTTVQMPNSMRVILVAVGGVAVALDKIIG